MFKFSSVNACICTSISWYFNKMDQIAFSELEKSFLQRFHSFCKMTAEVLRNNCAKRHKDWKFPWYILDISKLAGSKLTRCRVCLGYVHTVPDRFLLRFKSCFGTVWTGIKDVHRRQKLATDFFQTFKDLTILVVNISISRKKNILTVVSRGSFFKGLDNKIIGFVHI